jgi:DNA-binding transcriptional regulator/RsmH inhibitor MraZ
MNIDSISEVAIDSQGRLLIYPQSHTYPMIYREAVEVHWDQKGRFLYSPKPREWSYLDWFKHIITTVGDLALSPNTRWTDIPDELRRDAEEWMHKQSK